MYRLIFLAIFFLSGCMSSRYDMNMSMSDVSGAIVSSAEPVVDVRPNSRSWFSSSVDVSVSNATSFAGQSAVEANLNDPYADESSSVFINGSDHYFLFIRRSALNFGVSKYKFNQGWELAYLEGDASSQVRLAGFYQDVDFNDPVAAGFSKPFMLGLELDIRGLKVKDPFTAFAGIRFSTAIFHYNLNKPVSIGYETFNSDALGVFGLGVPVGVQFNSGALSLEAAAIPTLYFHGFETQLGFENDFVFLNTSIPISVGIGVKF